MRQDSRSRRRAGRADPRGGDRRGTSEDGSRAESRPTCRRSPITRPHARTGRRRRTGKAPRCGKNYGPDGHAARRRAYTCARTRVDFDPRVSGPVRSVSAPPASRHARTRPRRPSDGKIGVLPIPLENVVAVGVVADDAFGRLGRCRSGRLRIPAFRFAGPAPARDTRNASAARVRPPDRLQG